MLGLIVAYGLRTSEVVALKLEHVDWRAGRIRVPQCKTTSPLLLPLVDFVGDSLLLYLREGRPEVPYREIHRQTGVSVTTIGRVARYLGAGNGGYALAARRLAER